VMNPATPCLFVSRPGVFCVDCAIEWINWSSWGGRWSSRGRRWGCGWWSREGRRWNDDGRCRQSGGRATPAHCHAAKIFLGLGPHRIVTAHWARHSAIVWLSRGRPRKEPQKQWNQQQETQKATAGDDASEISSRSHHVEISSVSSIFICGLLDVLSLP